jgi:hypothetical protein
MGKQTKHIDENLSAQYVDWLRGEGPKPKIEVIEHVASCFRCKEELLELAEILDSEDRAQGLIKNKRTNLKIILRAAAVLAGVLVVALAIEFLKGDQQDDALVDDQTEINPVKSNVSKPLINDTSNLDDSIQEPTVMVIQHDTIKYAENFKINPGLEVLIEANFRSENNLASTNILRQQCLIGDTLKLNFSGFDQEGKIFSLISNLGRSVKDVNVQEVLEFPLLDLDPGLYYWKLVTSDEILVLGNFKLFSKSN